jgi:hypothetical protein
MIKQIGTNPMTFDVFVQNGSGMISGLVTFGEDDNGELYASNLAGTLFAVSASGPLPIQWEAVKAYKVLKGNRIQWALHQTFGIKHFDVQRSINPSFSAYTVVGLVEPVPEQIHYQFYDSFIQTQPVFYRIAAILDDGSTEYSTIVRILSVSPAEPSMVFNQNTGLWQIDLPDVWQKGVITLYDALGKEVYSRTIVEDQIIELSTPIIPGSYFIKIKSEPGIWSEQVIW